MPNLRDQQLSSWLGASLGDADFRIEPASSDASHRRYLRVHDAGGSRIVMDAPPDREDCRPWLAVAELFRDAGLHVPEVHAADTEQGFLLMQDMGDVTYLQALDEGADADGLYDQATSALVRLQAATRPGILPEYDAVLMRRELDLFPEWYIGRHLGVNIGPAEQEMLERVFALILAAAQAQARVFVHRDWHSRNLMVVDPAPGVLDFQDAVHGPVTYDLVSLFKDAYIQWEEERVLDWIIRYWEKARAAGLPVQRDFAAFHQDFEWMGVQRHLKVLGIFARLWHRDGKEQYLADMPRVRASLLVTCRRYQPLAPLAALLDRLEGNEARVVYSF